MVILARCQWRQRIDLRAMTTPDAQVNTDMDVETLEALARIWRPNRREAVVGDWCSERAARAALIATRVLTGSESPYVP
jgi:hypothetical protein